MTNIEIRMLRDSLGLSQAEFAQGLHVSQQLVNFWERGLQPSPYHYWMLRGLAEAIKRPAQKEKIISAINETRKQKKAKDNAKALLALGALMFLAFASPLKKSKKQPKTKN